MTPTKARQMVLQGVRNVYPHAVSAASIKQMGLLPTAEQLVRAKLIVKSKFKNGVGYKLADPTPGIPKRQTNSGPAYEREVARATELLRQSMGTKPRRKSRK